MIAAAVPHAGTLRLGAVAGLAHPTVLGARLLGTRRLDVAPRGAGSPGDRVVVVVDESEKRPRSMGIDGARIDVVGNTPPLAQVRGSHAVLRRYHWERDAGVLLDSVGRAAEEPAYALQ